MLTKYMIANLKRGRQPDIMCILMEDTTPYIKYFCQNKPETDQDIQIICFSTNKLQEQKLVGGITCRLEITKKIYQNKYNVLTLCGH